MATDLRDRKVRDLMHDVQSKPALVRKGDQLQKVVEALAASPATSTVYVVDRDGRLVGQIGVRVLIRQVANRLGVGARGVGSFVVYVRDMLRDSVEQFMSPSESVNEDETIPSALRKMVESGQTDIPVVDAKMHVIGELNGTEILAKARKALAEGSGGPGPADADQR